MLYYLHKEIPIKEINMETIETTATELIENYIEGVIENGCSWADEFSEMTTLAEYYGEKHGVEPEDVPEWTNGIVVYVYGEGYVISHQTWEEQGENGVRFTVEIEVNGESIGAGCGEWEDWGDVPDLIEKVKAA
jgi:hypothetical protein